MIQYRQITLSEAMDLIVSKQVHNLYFKKVNDDLTCAVNYSVNYEKIHEKEYYVKEDIKENWKI